MPPASASCSTPAGHGLSGPDRCQRPLTRHSSTRTKQRRRVDYRPDTETARQAAQQVQVLTGQKAVVVVSEDADASVLLRNFGQQALPWLVAVRMVSEGVDIPRLRVMLSTNITTRMYFRQAVGRVVRRQTQPKDEQLASFIPGFARTELSTRAKLSKLCKRN